MKSRYKIYKLLSFLFLIITIICNAEIPYIYSDRSDKNVLIINSYQKSLSWTDEQTQGIVDILESYDGSPTISVEYMDWKNHPTEENLKNIYNNLKYKYSGKKIDVVITTDDAALDFALKNRDEIFPDTPIVFCGVNEQGIAEITKGYSQFTGVKEIIDPESTMRDALYLKPDINEVYLLYDNTESGISTGEIVIEAIKNVKPGIKINQLNNKSIKDIIEEVGHASNESIVLIATYYIDPNGVVVGFEDFSRLVGENSSAPVFHLYDFGINNGAIGGCMVSGRLQGEAAGKMVTRILDGEDIGQIPVESSTKASCIFDYQELIRFNIPLERVPEGSTMVNKPFSFFETYKNIVIIAAIIFSLLILFIIMLATYLGKIGRMKGELEIKHEELIESDNKLRQQFNELMSTQQMLSSSEKRYSLLFGKMLNAFCVFEPVTDESGRIVDVRFIDINPGFKDQLGTADLEIVGKTWMEVFKYPNKNLDIYYDILLTGEGSHFGTYYPDTDLYFSSNAFKISDNQVGVVFNNITEYKQAINEVTILNEELEHRVIERTDELQSALNELESFSYTVSHDLKSPLRAINGYSVILEEDFGYKLGEEGSEIIGNIRHICSDMIEMISKLLEYSSTSKTDILKEEVNIEERFKEIYKELMSANPGRDVTLEIETALPLVFADKVMIRQAIYNILSNAVKFTNQRDKAVVTVGFTSSADEYIFHVKDNGAGLDMNYAGRVFGIFQRLHSNDEFEGSGIGLVTVKKIIQRHGGRVWIEGEVDIGATVYFTLPNSR